MHVLRRLSEVRTHLPAFRPTWKVGGGDTICRNPGFADVLHAVVCRDDGEPLYDQPVWAEAPGVVIVGVDAANRIAVLDHYRTAPFSGGLRDETRLDLREHGRRSLEFPRGLSKPGESPLETAVREAEEETGLAATSATLIGETNQNTTYLLFSTPIVRVQLEDRPSAVRADPTEPIARPADRATVFRSPREIAALIASGQIFCGFTKSAFATHVSGLMLDSLP